MKTKPLLLPRLRIISRNEIAFGPGKAELLALIAKTGSIRDAAKRMDMSYMRAWSLIQEMNKCFNVPLVEAARGGNQRGGASLTAAGKTVVKLYRKMEKSANKAMAADWRALQKFLQ